MLLLLLLLLLSPLPPILELPRQAAHPTELPTHPVRRAKA
jgi:hypothetical protein